jgi:hypothetical protein
VAAAANQTRSSDLADLPIRMKPNVLASVGDQREAKTAKAAKDFTLEEVVHVFVLKYSTVMSELSRNHTWKIEDLPDTRKFHTTPSFGNVFTNPKRACVRG